MAVYDQFVLCKAAALIFAVARWLLSVALNLPTGFSNSAVLASPRCSSSNVRTMIRSSLTLTTLGNIDHKLPEGGGGGGGGLSCAVCLTRLRKSSQVWELSNCCHVFHKNCLEKWLCYDSRLTCPLCRAPLLAAASSVQPQPPSWAVERMLYLFGDDLLP